MSLAPPTHDLLGERIQSAIAHDHDTAASSARNLWIKLLPMVSPSSMCTQCGDMEWYCIEIGWEQWIKATVEDDDGRLLGVSDGWDDMSEGGTHSWMACQSCGQPHQTPDHFEWG